MDSVLFLDRAEWRILHFAGLAIFLGNVIVTAVWKALADRTRDPRTVAFAQRLVTLTDWVFTVGGVALILSSGFAMAHLMGWGGFEPAWLRWGLGLFVASGVLWGAILIPIQIVQARMARDFCDGGPIPHRYWTLARIWLWVGIVAVLLPMVNLYLMVVKP
ncbi:DUF2269 domain-containing protein [Roseospira marina]|uniref:DUF2269 domain-containing protein n=1 Tax=Roseospira marina TaxID=140057 RepID=A0A5M6I9B0_9PROT|nr:DUF2269 domain-containing protein [Roseospira marina]KAA5604547.1 DUF2269 domain-containing protein [Roseospira marina]MBB4315293.1 putative membrane protein [Roseospira marina]MBB5088292.1 putative membrane protein [Roseospira marina]